MDEEGSSNEEFWEVQTMRIFLNACVAAVILAIAAALVLNVAVQEPVSVAFTTSGVRL